MISTEELRQSAVRRFIDTLSARDERAFADTVSSHFAYTCGEEKGGAADFYQEHTRFVVTDQSSDGCTVTGVMLKSGRQINAEWTFVPRAFKDVLRLDITTDVEIPDRDFADAMMRLHSAPNEPRTPEGTLRRLKLGDHYYVHRWERGTLGTFDWINSGEKANDPDVYRTYRSPADGDRTDKVKASKVTSHLTLDLGWDDTYQQATVRFHAKPYYAEPLVWREEHMRMADDAIPRITATLTLTGPPTLTVPDGKVISSEEITVRGTEPPYPLDFTRTFPLTGIPLGTCTLTLTHAVKTGGHRSGAHDTTVHLKDHTLTFEAGG